MSDTDVEAQKEHGRCARNHLRAAIDQMSEALFDIAPVNTALARSIEDAAASAREALDDVEVWTDGR